jgi:hypothetical protein
LGDAILDHLRIDRAEVVQQGVGLVGVLVGSVGPNPFFLIGADAGSYIVQDLVELLRSETHLGRSNRAHTLLLLGQVPVDRHHVHDVLQQFDLLVHPLRDRQGHMPRADLANHVVKLLLSDVPLVGTHRQHLNFGFGKGPVTRSHRHQVSEKINAFHRFVSTKGDSQVGHGRRGSHHDRNPPPFLAAPPQQSGVERRA